LRRVILKSGNFFIAALGCPKNLVEAEIISGTMLAEGYSICFDPADADIYIVDTCAFLPAARSEAADEIYAAVQWKNERSGRVIAVAGCLLNHAELSVFKAHFPEVDLWVPVNDTAGIPALLRKEKEVSTDKEITFLGDEKLPKMQLTIPHVAYLKISDGCDNRCAYCAIPELRGKLRSRTAASVLAEAEQLISNGVKELIVIGQDITAFGHDRPEAGEDLAYLLRRLNELPGDFSIRLLYTHPAHYTDELIGLIAAGGKILPYLDIPLQHISNRILKDMNRHIDTAGIETLLTKLRKNIPGLVLRSTFITGLPGESEAEFEELCDFIRRWKFERLGVFSFAPEPGTPAAGMPGQIPVEIADARARKILKNQIARMKRAQKRLVGSVVEALVDDVDGYGVAIARSAADAPEIDNVIRFAAWRGVKPGKRVLLRITGCDGCDLVAEKFRKNF